MKNRFVYLLALCVPLTVAQASVITFSGAISGATSFSFDSDGDSISDVIFTTTDPAGFNTAGPGPNMTYINEPGLEGTTSLNPDLSVQFLNGATGVLSFGFAVNLAGSASFSVYDSSNVLLGSTSLNAAFTNTPGGLSSFPEGLLQLPFNGTAAYAHFNFTGTANRYIIDNFTGNFGSTERRDVPDTGGTASLFVLGLAGAFLIHRRSTKGAAR